MKKFLILAATAAVALVACNKQDAPQAPELNNAEADQFPVELGANIARTRAGAAGLMDRDLLMKGFGVFGYYTGNNSYDDQATPNFMYNQKVENTGSAWTYAPIKYWPNQYGSAAISDDVDKVSFFAYAPYVEVTPATGKVVASASETQDVAASYGIAGMIRNTQSGDPILKYIGSFDPAKSIDLCWGVAAAADASAWNITNTGAAQTPAIAPGLAWKDVQRPANAVDQKLKFTFKHALSKLNVTIDADVDIDGIGETNALAEGTKIYVRSISFTGLAMKGALNLNNIEADKAYWLDYAGTNDLMTGDEFVLYDGRKDGKEGAAGAIASNEKSLGLNPVIISDDGNSKAGVTNTAVNLFNSADAEAPVYIIPTGDDIEINIEYDIETEDPALPGLLSDGAKKGSSIPCKIRKSVKFGDDIKAFENGKAYTIKLHLGMNSVKFDADVTAWDDAVSTDVELPSNAAAGE